MCILMGKSLAVFRNTVFHSMIFMLKMRKSTVFEKNDFQCIFDRFEVHVITVWSKRLGKTQNICIFANGRFLRVFKITHFLKFLKDF